MPTSCQSEITQVTVYARGALVTRRVTIPKESLPVFAKGRPAEDHDFIISNLTPLAEPGSVRVGVGSPGWQLLSVTSALHVPDTTATVGPSVALVEELAGRITRIQAELERLQGERQKLGKLVLDPGLRTTSLVEKVEQRVSDALATATLVHELQADLDRRLARLEAQLLELQQQHRAAELSNSLAQSSARIGQGHPFRKVVVRLSGSGPLDELTLSYVVPAARFWPVYTLRISDGGRKAGWLLEALVAQRTGEDWQDVRLSLSTADLMFDARLPELPSLRLGRAQSPPRRGYRPPPPGLDQMFVGYDRAFGAGDGGLADTYSDDEEQALRAPSDAILESTIPAPPPAKKSKRRSEPPLPPAVSVGGLRPPTGMNLGAAYDGAPPMQQAPGRPPPPSPLLPPQAAAPMMEMPEAAFRAAAPKGGFGRGRAAEQVPEITEARYNEGGMDLAGGGGGPGGIEQARRAEPVPSPLEPQDTWLDFERLVMAAAEDYARRGRLIRRHEVLGQGALQEALSALEGLQPLEGVRDPLTSRGRFDHRYDSSGTVQVASNGQTHRVALLSAETTPALRLITVPRERPEVYREAELKNPVEAPLLAGPVDVYVEGSLLTTAAIEHIDRGGTLRVGMGVEERVRVARNVRAEEETAGLLGGSTMITHHVSIEVSSALGQQAALEILERLPVSDDKSVSIELIAARPEPREYTQAERGVPVRGGMVWRLLLPTGGKSKVEYSYRITFPAKTEIVGGNRRD